MDTHVQNTGHWPARYPPLPPFLPAFSHVLRYGDLTARGIAGGRAGEKLEVAPATAAMTTAVAAAIKGDLIVYVGKNDGKLNEDLTPRLSTTEKKGEALYLGRAWHDVQRGYQESRNDMEGGHGSRAKHLKSKPRLEQPRKQDRRGPAPAHSGHI